MKGLHQEKSLENLKQHFGQVFSGLVILDDAGGVSMMSTDAAHQRLLVQLQTSRQWNN